MTSSSSRQTGKTQAIRCSICQTTFTRAEHLNRHARSHTAEKPFGCAQCDKRFSRLDVLQRHTQSHLPRRLEGKTGHHRACRSCAVSRVRCSRESPCERCNEKGMQCVYPSTRKRKSHPESTRRSVRPCPSSATFHPHTIDAAVPSDPTGAIDSSLLRDPPRTRGGIDGQSQTFNGSDYILNTSGINGGFTLEPEIGMMDGLELSYPDIPTVGNRSKDNMSNDWFSSVTAVNWLSPEYSEAILPEGLFDWFPLPNTIAESGGQELANDELQLVSEIPLEKSNTMDHSFRELQSAEPGPEQTNTPLSDDIRSTNGRGSTIQSPASQAIDGEYYVEGYAGRMPFKGRSSRRRGCISQDSTDSPGSLPTMSGGSVTTSPRDWIPHSIYQEMLERVTVEYSSATTGIDRDDFPCSREIQELAQLYYDGFHPTYPFLLEPQYQFTSTDSWLLLLAVAAVGSRYATLERHQAAGSVLTSILDHILCRRVYGGLDADNERPWSLNAGCEHDSELELLSLNAKLLNCMLLLHSGREGSVRRGLLYRHQLVEACSSLKLFSKVEKSPEESNGQAVHEDRVEDWLHKESRLRTGWMIWILDFLIPYEFEAVPLLHIEDATAPLPCPEGIWHCPTVYSLAKQINDPLTLTDALEGLYIEKSLPANLGDLSAIVVIFAICRRNKEATAHHRSQLTSWSPNAHKVSRTKASFVEDTWPPALPILSKWRNSSCDCLDILHWAANSTAAQAGGWEHPTIFHLHISRLLLLAPIHHINRLTGPSLAIPPGQISDNNGYKASRRHVLRWAIHDQYKARLCVIHAGALLWHVRRYSSNSFLEPFGVHAATLVIWAYSVAVQFFKDHTAANAGSLNNDFSRDVTVQPAMSLATDGDESASDMDPSIIQIDRPCDDEIVQTYIRQGDRLSCQMSRVGDICSPGAPRKILEQGIRLLNREPYSKRRQATIAAEGSESSGVRPGWGTQHSFMESLRSRAVLAVATTPH